MNIFHLERNLKNASSLSHLTGVYWSCRDMDSFFIGNHHFVTFVYGSEEEAKRITEKWATEYFSETNDAGLEIFFTTMGAGKGEGTTKIRIKFNPSSDKKAIHEACKENNTSYIKPDKDFQAHRVPYDISIKNFSSHEDFMNEILEALNNFNAHYDGGDRVEYSLKDENCACTVNSLFRALRISKGDREELGEFEGVDWGEEDLIPTYYFGKPYYIGNKHTREIHEPNCEWLTKMEAENRVRFSNLKEAQRQGYNGCYYCLKKYNTG